MQATHTTSGHKCPYCQVNKLETTATAPYVRGFVLAYQMGSRTFIGCVPCVRKKTLLEAGKSSLLGWFSITSFIINPFLIVYNLGQGALTSANAEKVKRKLAEMGMPAEATEINLNEIGYLLASLMIKADGIVDEAEIVIAETIGEKIFPNFDEARFRLILNSDQQMPDIVDIASLINNVVDKEGKISILRYLIAIAESDGEVDYSEKQLLEKVAYYMGVDIRDFGRG